MERLTEKHYLGTDHYMKCSGNCNVDMDCIDCPSFDCLVERLAAYEDTWLEPEEIENGMCRIKERRSIWQNSLVYALCQAVRLLLMDKIKEGRK